MNGTGILITLTQITSLSRDFGCVRGGVYRTGMKRLLNYIVGVLVLYIIILVKHYAYDGEFDLLYWAKEDWLTYLVILCASLALFYLYDKATPDKK